MTQLDDALAALSARVEAATTVEASAMVYIQGVPALIQAAVDQAKAAGATPEQLQAIADLGVKLDAASGPLQTLLTANTSG